jgi:hypothetical protein
MMDIRKETLDAMTSVVVALNSSQAQSLIAVLTNRVV